MTIDFPFIIRNQHEYDLFRAAQRMEWEREDNDSKLIAYPDICKHFNISYETLYRWLKQKGIESQQYGKGKAIEQKDMKKLRALARQNADRKSKSA